MEKLNLGNCGICECEIFSRKGRAVLPNEDYAEVYLYFSDDTWAKHGICVNCYNSLTDQKVFDVYCRIQETWEEEMGSWAEPEDLDLMREKMVISWGKLEAEMYDNVIKYRKLESKKVKDK